MTNNITLELTKCERDAWKEIAESKMTADEFERCCESIQKLLNEYGEQLEDTANAQ